IFSMNPLMLPISYVLACIHIMFPSRSSRQNAIFGKALTLAAPMDSFIYSTPRCLDIRV
ncbi:unnamed protein product, partial [Heterotrigona itama]